MTDCDKAIGVFDSGLGGISVLAEAMRTMPGESFIYYGDSANAPYGTRSKEDIHKLTFAVADFLVSRGVKALLVACNTATSVAVRDLRRQYGIPVIGMEPALKPAVELDRPGKILVLATPVTLAEEKFRQLLARFGGEGKVQPVSCPGLVEIIENPASPPGAVAAYLKDLASGMGGQPVGAVVLGCTHYIFIRDEVAACFPEAAVIDGNRGTVLHLRRLLGAQGLLSDRPPGQRTVEIFTSGDPAQTLALYHRFLQTGLEESKAE